MHPFDDINFPMNYCIIDANGNVVNLGDAKVIEDEPVMDEESRSWFNTDCCGFAYTIMARIRYCRGMFDSLCGIPSIHAWRYKRLCKRHKEKQRRMKLKGAME